MLRALLVMLIALGAARAPLAQPCQWEPLAGADLTSVVRALLVHHHGSDLVLYAGGGFSETLGGPGNRVAFWDGAVWRPLGRGVSNGVYSLAIFDDGGGSALYAGGAFSRAGDIPDANGVARWDGHEWAALGKGLHNEHPTRGHAAKALAVFDDGSGPALYVGGRFTEAGGVPALNIARWDGSVWSAMGAGISGIVNALAVYDDGAGPALYAGGAGLWRWEGTSWSRIPIPGGVMAVDALGVFDDGARPALYVGGQFFGNIGRWDGESWTTPGGGMDAAVRSFHIFDDGGGPALYAGGAFLRAGTIDTYGIARWDGREWSDVGGGMYQFPIGPSVDAMATFDDGSGPALYVGGEFTHAGGFGGIPVDNIARFRCDSACRGDCDASGALDFLDFLCFQNHFAATTPYADCDDSGAHDFFDFLCFQNTFAVGCP